MEICYNDVKAQEKVWRILLKISLTGPVQLEIIERYFREAGYQIAAPGETPDIIYDVTAHDKELSEETEGFYDERLDVLAGCPYSLDGIKAIVEEFGWFLLSCTSEESLLPKKVLAVDADNTLWKGILSEDGKDALKPYSVFQDGLKNLAAEGVVLILLSKNDPGSIDLDYFPSKKVNWEPKAGNLIEACRELDLGVESVVFVDDNPHERAQMKAHLKEVMVAPWTGWSERASEREQRQLIRRLKEYFFNPEIMTEEDRLRAVDYSNRVLRESLSMKCATKEEYLEDLGLWVEAREAEARDLDRLAQMAGKTNQFNATTLRRTRKEFAEMLSTAAGKYALYVFRAGDKFGEQGIVCYVVVDIAAAKITDFVMSCRAMGRTLEFYAYRWTMNRVKEKFGIATLAINFAPTAKNAPFKAFLDEVNAGGELKNFYRTKN